MRVLIDFQFPIEPFNTLVRAGTAGEKIEAILAAIQPEAVYFTARDGKRGGTMVVDLKEASQIPAIAEPLFLTFEATVDFRPMMMPEDLASAGLDELGKKWGG